MENDTTFREELRLMAERLRQENEALLKLINELNNLRDIHNHKNAIQKPKTIKP
jgi:hypothetical protein